MKKTTVVSPGDLLSHAETLGYTWNGAHKILFEGRDGLETSRNYSDIEEYSYSDEQKKILLSFMEKNKLKEFYMEPH